MKNYPITIETGEHAGETVWVHRNIAVAGFIFCRINNDPKDSNRQNVTMRFMSVVAFNNRHPIEGIFHTYVDCEEVEGLDDLFAE